MSCALNLCIARHRELDEIVIAIRRNDQLATSLRNVTNGPWRTHHFDLPQAASQASDDGQEQQSGHKAPH